MRGFWLAFVAGAAAVALVATSATAAVQWRRAAEAEQRVEELARDLAVLESEVERLEAELEAAQQADPLADLLRQLLGDGAGLFELFGGDLDDLLGDLGELFGGEVGGLGDLLGDVSTVPGAACLTPDDGSLAGMLDGLLAPRPVPDDPDELVALIADDVAELREHVWTEPVEVAFLDGEATRERLEELLLEAADPEEAEVDQRLLEALGAIPPGTDLIELQRELLGQAVAGFYVPETGELVVRVPASGAIRPLDQITLAHELQHALADQHLGLPDLDAIEDSDARLAAVSVIEGDATLSMQLWALEHLSLGDQLSMATAPDVLAAQQMLDDVPHFLQRQLLFPYTEGLDLVCSLYLEGGWEAVDAAYHEPPLTSAEVVHPDRAGSEPASTAELASPPGWTLARTDSFGLAALTWLFEAPGDDRGQALPAASDRAAAWAGGELRVWTSGSATAVGVALVDGGGEVPLCASVTDWYDAAFPDATRRAAEGATVFRSSGTVALVACDGEDVRLASAPDAVTATHILGGG